MTDDEAFIRRLVDSPGDDLPRLVYADWLDERGDPRGAYLRAEAVWAKPWRDGTPPGWTSPTPDNYPPPEWGRRVWPGLKRMRRLAAGFDPVWVARVSRPPAGVCCDHLTLTKSGPRLSPADVAAGEARLGYLFPPAFTAFLLHSNGGEPSPAQLVYRSGGADEGDWDWVVVEAFGQLRPAGEAGTPAPAGQVETLESIRDDLTYWHEGDDSATARAARGYLPFGRMTLSFLLLRTVGRGAGAVLLFDPETENPTPEPLVPSLPELLGRIIPNPGF